MAVIEIHAKFSGDRGDLNVQIKGLSKLHPSFPPNIYWLLRKESAETTNLIHFFLGVQQQDFDGDNIIKRGHCTQ